jgi:hypothetical protein
MIAGITSTNSSSCTSTSSIPLGPTVAGVQVLITTIAVWAGRGQRGRARPRGHSQVIGPQVALLMLAAPS